MRIEQRNSTYTWYFRLVPVYTNLLDRKKRFLIDILVLFRFLYCFLGLCSTLLLLVKLEAGVQTFLWVSFTYGRTCPWGKCQIVESGQPLDIVKTIWINLKYHFNNSLWEGNRFSLSLETKSNVDCKAFST